MSIFDNIKLLKNLNKEELNSLEMFCQQRFISKGEILFKEGDEANSLYLLKKGKIEVYTHKNGEEIILGYIKAEDILGEMAIFGKIEKRTASARALEDSELIILLDFSIKELLKKHPEIMQKIKDIIKKRQQENSTKL